MIQRKSGGNKSTESAANGAGTIAENTVENTEGGRLFLAGTARGLYRVDGKGNISCLWPGQDVRKIIRAGSAWLILSGEGIFRSLDLKQWEKHSGGLPEKTIKVFEDGKKSFVSVAQDIKDLEVNAANPEVMVCAVRNAVFLSVNGGISWRSLGSPSLRTDGIKAAASAYLPAGESPELVIFMSHSVYGCYYITPDIPGAEWTAISGGLEELETTGNADEVSDISVGAGPDGSPVVYASQMFRKRVYRLDWSGKRFVPLWSGGEDFGAVDSLDPETERLRFLAEGTVYETRVTSPRSEARNETRERRDIADLIRNAASDIKPDLLCAFIEGKDETVSLSELWLLLPAKARKPQAAGRKGLYLPVNHAGDPSSLKPYLETMARGGLDMIVVDMKDDYGRLRFTPKNSAASLGRVFRPLDVEAFCGEMKKRGIYTVARIVVFKDPVLAAREGGRYAVWDTSKGGPWEGYRDIRRKKTEARTKESLRTEILPADDPEYEILRTWYDEKWVDPYAEEIWEYTAAVAGELHERGFDEIQFDYIRFPTDGANLADAQYRWQDPGMDAESAIISFMRHIRGKISAPVSIDVYGANGWYRSSARTGQDVEFLSTLADVICPMYYPSHFEQDFLAQDPGELRPYRIYRQGSSRTGYIGRGRIIVRPYVQAFYLNVSYDRKYYGPEYVRLEAEGVRDAGNGGLTYWNNSGRYEDIPAVEP